MGRLKEMMIDQENGLMHTFDGDKKVCAEHFRDPYLQDYIRKNGRHEGLCSYCGKEHTLVLDMQDFMQHVEERLSQRLCSLNDANLPLSSSYYDDDKEVIPGVRRAGSFILPEKAETYEDVQDLMDSYGLYTLNNDLNEDIASCFKLCRQKLLRKTLMKSYLMNGIIFLIWLSIKNAILFSRIRIS